MRILFTADLHLLRATRDGILKKVRNWMSLLRPDGLVIAGDIASASQASDALREIRRCVPDAPIAVCLGNHDFWLHEDARNECRGLSEVIDRYWAPAAEATGITLLDRQNFMIGTVTIVGGYGHYDLGFAYPGLGYRGVAVTEEDYARGFPYAESPLRWRDFEFMPGPLHPRSIAFDQVRSVTARIRAVGDSPLVVVLHTPPFEELLGIAPAAALPDGSPPSQYAFFRAYLGNRAMGDALQNVDEKPLAVVCGHTHRAAGPARIHDMIGVNIGSDYGRPEAAVYSCKTMTMERVPDL